MENRYVDLVQPDAWGTGVGVRAGHGWFRRSRATLFAPRRRRPRRPSRWRRRLEGLAGKVARQDRGPEKARGPKTGETRRARKKASRPGGGNRGLAVEKRPPRPASALERIAKSACGSCPRTPPGTREAPPGARRKTILSRPLAPRPAGRPRSRTPASKLIPKRSRLLRVVVSRRRRRDRGQRVRRLARRHAAP